MFVVARTRVAPELLANPFRRVVQNIDPHLAVGDVRSLQSRLSQARLPTNILGGTFAVFAGIALVLAMTGLYATITNFINQRTQEIGIRMAVGGTSRNILQLVYLQGMLPTLVGIAIGLPSAFALARFLRSTLIGVTPNDPFTFFIAVVLLVLAAILACAVPAIRALNVDPIVALRYE